jgi:hypothetical protein
LPQPYLLAATSPNDDLRSLLIYLRFSYEYCAPQERRYFDALGARLADHGVLGRDETIDRNNFREALRAFQSQVSLSSDGIPGEDTLWELQSEWARNRDLEIQRVKAEVYPGRGGSHYFYVREDVVPWYEALRAQVTASGGIVTSAGAFRELEAPVTAGRSAISMHYSGLALDLSTQTGMLNPDDDPYIITRENDRWRVWARADGGAEQTLEAVVWKGGQTTTRLVEARVLDLTTEAERHDFSSIRPRNCFPIYYMCAEWWHFQLESLLVPGISQFGIELLSLRRYSESALSAATGIWANKKRIFKRAQNG